MTKMEDPVAPTVTFDSYVRPETVKQKPNVRALVQARYQAIVQRRAKKANDQKAAETQTADQAKAPRQTWRAALQASGAAWLSHLPPASPVTAAAAIAVLTFALGVLVTLKVAGPQDVAGTTTSDPQAVTRQQNPDLTSTATMQQQQKVVALSKGADTPADPQDMAQQIKTAMDFVGSDRMQMLRETALAGGYTIAEKDTGGINRLALALTTAETGTTPTADLLLTAADQGDLTIPAALSTPEGQMDTDTMLFSLIQSTLLQDEAPESRAAAREMSRRVFAASNATTQRSGGQRIYVVRPGDSLAYIAMQFYGRPDAYTRILTANTEVMASPNEIRTGQQLIIPE